MRRLFGASAEALIIVTLVFGLLAFPVLAAKGGNDDKARGGDGDSSLALVLIDPADSTANHGDEVTFTVATTATDRPFVKVNCYQSGALVYAASAGFFADYPWPWARNFTLASSYWTGGAADCSATLYTTRSNGRVSNLATLNFAVAE